jgi:class 3 adenylate cyclase
MRGFRLRDVGTRVFLFTDIEGSTKLWSDSPALMPAALARHDDLITRAVVRLAERCSSTRVTVSAHLVPLLPRPSLLPLRPSERSQHRLG